MKKNNCPFLYLVPKRYVDKYLSCYMLWCSIDSTTERKLDRIWTTPLQTDWCFGIERRKTTTEVIADFCYIFCVLPLSSLFHFRSLFYRLSYFVSLPSLCSSLSPAFSSSLPYRNFCSFLISVFLSLFSLYILFYLLSLGHFPTLLLPSLNLCLFLSSFLNFSYRSFSHYFFFFISHFFFFFIFFSFFLFFSHPFLFFLFLC